MVTTTPKENEKSRQEVNQRLLRSARINRGPVSYVAGTLDATAAEGPKTLDCLQPAAAFCPQQPGAEQLAGNSQAARNDQQPSPNLSSVWSSSPAGVVAVSKT
jgi:hypothetical protein